MLIVGGPPIGVLLAWLPVGGAPIGVAMPTAPPVRGVVETDAAGGAAPVSGGSDGGG